MTQEHPITPPEELVDQWNEAWIDAKVKHEGLVTFIATQAARWGADQELEACCADLRMVLGPNQADWLRSVRRPKPPSLKAQALALISHDPENQPFLSEKGIAIIRRALESLPD